ncbi:hypothetical protein Tco_0079781 [Tanacetum coccineum]
MSLITRRVSAICACAYGQSLEALPSQPAASGSKSHVPGAGSESEYPATVAVFDMHRVETRVHYYLLTVGYWKLRRNA